MPEPHSHALSIETGLEAPKSKLETLKWKVEFMYFKLGGEADGYGGKAFQKLDVFQENVIQCRKRIKDLKELMRDRNELVRIHGHQS